MANLPIITLTSDQGLKDPYVAMVKGSIYSELPEARIVDISHQIQAFNLHQAAYILGRAYRAFPEGTVHIIGVDAVLHSDKPHIALKCNGHFFVGNDNGIFSLLFPDTRPEQMVVLKIGRDDDAHTFPMNDLFVRAACHLARGGQLGVIGDPWPEWTELSALKPIISENRSIRGAIIYFDEYGNAVTNISYDLIRKTGGSKSLEIILPRSQRITKIGFDYESGAQDGKATAVINSAGLMEISLFRGVPNHSGTAESLLGLKYRDPIQVHFK